MLTLVECSDKLIKKYVPVDYLQKISYMIPECIVTMTTNGHEYFIGVERSFTSPRIYQFKIIKVSAHSCFPLNDIESCKFIIEHFEDIKKYLLSRVDKIREETNAKKNERIRTQNCLSKLNRLIESDRP